MFHDYDSINVYFIILKSLCLYSLLFSIFVIRYVSILEFREELEVLDEDIF